MNGSRVCRLSALTLAMVMAVAVGHGWAADDASMTGTVIDPLGARVGGAAVKLLLDGTVVKEATSDGEGNFGFDALASGRYQIEASAAGFRTRTTDPMFVGGGARVAVEVALPIGPLEESVSVTSAATGVMPSQIGAPVTVLDSRTLEILGKTDVLEALRLVPAARSSRAAGRAASRRSSFAAATPISTRCSSTAFRPTTSAAASISHSSRWPAWNRSKCCARPTVSSRGPMRWPA